jgi:hypothetical protein
VEVEEEEVELMRVAVGASKVPDSVVEWADERVDEAEDLLRRGDGVGERDSL